VCVEQRVFARTMSGDDADHARRRVECRQIGIGYVGMTVIASSNRLVVPPVRLATVGGRAFAVAAAHTWNSLPEHIVSASTLQSFTRHLKTFLLQQSFRLAL